MMTLLGKRPFLLLILLSYLLITVSYGVINPLFEAPDENWHYFTVQYIAETGELPFVAAGDSYDKWLSQEAAQPPLYYLIGSLLIAPIDTSTARDEVWTNPFTWVGDASAITNLNRFVHTDVEAWPWRGYALAAHILRLLSTLFGLGTLVCVYGNGRLLWPSHPSRALLATALVAFLPQFNFLHASVSNDSLVIFLSSAAIWQLVWLWQKAPTNNPPWRLLLLGSTVGLAALAKSAGILLFVYTLGFIFIKWLRDKSANASPVHTEAKTLTRLIFDLAFVVIPVLAIAGWLWWRNWTLYGDPTAASVFIRIAGGDRDYTFWQVVTESDGLWTSLFGVFGWFNLRSPEWVYAIWDSIVALGVLGLLLTGFGFLRGSSRPSFQAIVAQALPLLLFGWILAVYAGLVNFMLQTEAAQGRLLLPAIVPMALGVAYGLTAWQEMALTRYLGQGLLLLTPLLALTTTLTALFLVIRPTYAQPQLLAELPSHVEPLSKPVGEHLILLGAAVPETAVLPNETFPITLYWQANALPPEPPKFVLQLFGRDTKLIGQLHSYHGRGLYPATLWPQNKIVAEQLLVRADETAVLPTQGRIFVGIDSDPNRHEISPVKIIPHQWPEPLSDGIADLGGILQLTQANLEQPTAKAGDTVTFSVQWEAIMPSTANLTTLLHLGEAGQPPLTQGDRPPVNGNYPTTLWESGEIINDSYAITLPADLAAGRYPLWIGMYDPATLQRLPLSASGVRQPHDQFLIDYLEIAP